MVASKEAVVFPFKYNLVLKKFIYFSLSSALTIYYFERVASLKQLSEIISSSVVSIYTN